MRSFLLVGIGHGLRRVRGEVQHDLVNLGGVRPDLGDIVVHVHLECELSLREHRANQAEHLFRQRSELRGSSARLLLAAEGQQPARQRGGPVGGLGHLRQLHALGVSRFAGAR